MMKFLVTLNLTVRNIYLRTGRFKVTGNFEEITILKVNPIFLPNLKYELYLYEFVK